VIDLNIAGLPRDHRAIRPRRFLASTIPNVSTGLADEAATAEVDATAVAPEQAPAARKQRRGARQAAPSDDPPTTA
jgi:hypothetical protein